MTPNRRGFALLAVLWLVAALGTIAAVGLAAGRMGQGATRNRILLTRAAWAREACVAIILADFAEDTAAQAARRPMDALGPVDLGRGAWCDARIEDPAARINLNLADSVTLMRLLEHSELTAALLDRRRQSGPLAAVAELRFVAGIDSTTMDRLALFATTRGSGAVNVNEASPEVLGAIVDLPREALEILQSRRRVGRPVGSLDELLALASRPTREMMLHDYAGWLSRMTFAPAQFVAHVTGGIAGTPITSRATLTLAPVANRLAILRRESE